MLYQQIFYASTDILPVNRIQYFFSQYKNYGEVSNFSIVQRIGQYNYFTMEKYPRNLIESATATIELFSLHVNTESVTWSIFTRRNGLGVTNSRCIIIITYIICVDIQCNDSSRLETTSLIDQCTVGTCSILRG